MNWKIGDDIRLKMITEEDVKPFFELVMKSKEHLKMWLGRIDFIKEENDIATYFKVKIEAASEHNGNPIAFGIFYRDELAGTIEFSNIDKSNKIGRIAYWLGNSFQNKGIMSKALNEIIDYGFDQLKLNKIEITTAVDNHKSRALPERLGFKEEGRIRQAQWLYDRYVDHIIYGLLKSEKIDI